MSSLADLPEVIGFFSYSREDDEAYEGTLSGLRDAIQRELSAQLGRSRTNFRLWQDQKAIAPGKLWELEIKTAVKQAVFFIPIVTPRAVNSHYCQFEFEEFLAREQELGRSDLVFPLLYIRVPALESEAQWRNDPVLSIIGSRQYVDWRPLRHLDARTPTVREQIERFCDKIVEALREPWVSPQERRLEAARRAEEEKRRAEAARQVEEERQQAETARQAERETRRAKPTRSAPRIAIIYRREDSAVITARIFDRLVAHYGAGSVFRDGDNIPLGVSFREYINSILVRTDITLVVIGKSWFGPLERRGRRIDNPSDPVRVEVETALHNGMPVVPVFVEDGTMPTVDQLPDSLKELAYRNGLDVDSGRDFDQHIERLIRSMEPILAQRAQDIEAAPQAEEEKRQAEEERQGAEAEEERQRAEAARQAEEEKRQAQQARAPADTKTTEETWYVKAIFVVLLFVVVLFSVFGSERIASWFRDEPVASNPAPAGRVREFSLKPRLPPPQQAGDKSGQ
jgi:hypothetical protein